MAIEWIKRQASSLFSLTSTKNRKQRVPRHSLESMANGYQNKQNLTLNKWDKAHMQTAENYAELSSAKRAQVGCVLVKDHRIISIGYNGMPSGWTNVCETTDEYGFNAVTKEEVLHAETNAIAKVAQSNESAKGATLYTTCAPCLHCAKLIYQAGISRVVYRHEYRDKKGLTFLEQCDILLEQMEK